MPNRTRRGDSDGEARRNDVDDGSGGNGPSRRSFLATVGAAGTGVALAGCLNSPGGAGRAPAVDDFDRVPPDDGTEWGETVALGSGEVSTFVTTDSGGNPLLAGVEMTPGVLDGAGSGHVKYVVDFPATDAVPFGWLGLDWEPGGHYPGDTYAIPHFDFHFYFAPHDVIADVPTIALPPEDYDDDELYTHPMPADQVPSGYFRTNYVFGYMGEHLYDETAPEYHDGTFGNTFVYGHWDGELIFMEPMITLPYFRQLRAGGDSELAQLDGVDHTDHRELSTPDRFPEAGAYPTEYTVSYHEDRDVFTVVQHAFEDFEVSAGLPASADTSNSWESATHDESVDVRSIEDDGTDASGGGHTHAGSNGDGGHDTPTTGSGGTAASADATVTVAPEGRLVFEPETLQVDVGATVRFDWKADYHNVVPVDQPADSSWQGEPEIRNAGHAHVHTFEVAGRYDYVCEPHRSQGMVGAIVVGDG